MGWLRFDGHVAENDHEGFVVAVEKSDDGWSWRELGDADIARARRDSGIPVSWLQVGCSCGWRSPRLVAPTGTVWSPCSVFLPHSGDDEQFVEVWAVEHRDRLDLVEEARAIGRRRALGLGVAS